MNEFNDFAWFQMVNCRAEGSTVSPFRWVTIEDFRSEGGRSVLYVKDAPQRAQAEDE